MVLPPDFGGAGGGGCADGGGKLALRAASAVMAASLARDLRHARMRRGSCPVKVHTGSLPAQRINSPTCRFQRLSNWRSGAVIRQLLLALMASSIRSVSSSRRRAAFSFAWVDLSMTAGSV